MADEPAGGPLPLIVALIALYFLWAYLIDPMIKWVNENFIIFIALFAGLLIAAAACAILFVLPKIMEARDKQKAEAYLYGQVAPSRQAGGGLLDRLFQRRQEAADAVVKNSGSGKQSPQPSEKAAVRAVKKAFQQKMPAVSLNAVAAAITRFKPSKEYKDEFGYRSELSDHLAKSFPKNDVVLRTDPLLPDIGIDDVAIDVRAAAGDDAIGALISKCPKYRNVYSDLVILFLKPHFSVKANEKLLSSLKKDYPAARVITK